ncbi:MAG: 5-(carboxyamino)imidazole ribonucleotide synthase [Flavobacteriales bacterium]|nr:5-(carboxyamino)imidazole ribonucleotide synthase [Flavobacteriales bacterium]
MKKFYDKNFRLGILGGGQLGRMLLQEAIDLDIRTAVLDPSAVAPCASIANDFVQGDFSDYQTVVDFGKTCDVLTIEIEHVNVEALEKLQAEGLKIFPRPDILKIVKDKGLQKQFYRVNKIDTASFHLVENLEQVKQFVHEFPLVQKLRTGGYDGRGVQILRTESDLEKAFDAASVLEKMIDFEKEIAVIIARNEAGEVKTFPLVEMEFNPEANLVEFLFSPASVSEAVEKKAVDLATRIVEALNFVGILAVELFSKGEEVLVNEIAPRPHNSGHHTIEGCVNSQYAQHLRSILNLPLGDTTLLRPAVMVNLLGEKGMEGAVKYDGLEEVMAWPGVHVHLYGKTETKPFRKMGHVTVTDDDLDVAKRRAKEVLQKLRVRSGRIMP